MKPNKMDIWELFDAIDTAKMPRKTRKLVNELAKRMKVTLGGLSGIPYPD